MEIYTDNEVILYTYNNVKQNNSTVAQYIQILDNLREHINVESDIQISDQYNTVRFCNGLRTELKEQVAKIHNINRERALKVATLVEQNKFMEVYNQISEYNIIDSILN